VLGVLVLEREVVLLASVLVLVASLLVLLVLLVLVVYLPLVPVLPAVEVTPSLSEVAEACPSSSFLPLVGWVLAVLLVLDDVLGALLAEGPAATSAPAALVPKAGCGLDAAVVVVVVVVDGGGAEEVELVLLGAEVALLDPVLPALLPVVVTA
jgi:hypothetical protein